MKYLSFAIACALAPTHYVVAQEQEQDIETIEIKGRAMQFYRIDESAMATKTPTDFMDIPQSIQVINRELIDDQAARQTTDLYRTISGVSQFSYSGVTARGFRQDQVRYDGVQGDPYSGFSIPQLFNVERVEVLKGPSSMLYGGGQPGALINYVSKKPVFEDKTQLAIFGGNYSRKGASIDSVGSVGDSDTVAYRVGAFYEDRDTFRNNTEEKNVLLSGGLTFLLTDDTNLTIQYDHIDQDLQGHRIRGVPVTDDGHFITDISFNTNEATDFQNLKADAVQAILSHDFGNGFTNTTVLRYLDNERVQNYHEPRGLTEVDGVLEMRREFRAQRRTNEEISITTDFILSTEFGGIEHTLLFGGDYFDVDTSFSYQRAREEGDNVPNLNFQNPVYGADASTYDLTDLPRPDTAFERLGIYVQDQIRINDQWLALVGFRYDEFDDSQEGNDRTVSDSQITPRVGVIYQPLDTMSIFANLTRGFLPQSFGSQDNAFDDVDRGALLEPEESEQIEFGIKNEWFNNRFISTLTFYDITKENVSVGNPLDTGDDDGQPAQLQIGEVTSEGVELDIVGDIMDNWTGTFSYAFNNTKITGGAPDSIRNAVGTQFANAPKHTLGLWTRYDFPSIDSAIAIGVDHVGERISLGGQTVRSFTVWDASWRSNINDFEIQVNIRNLFDKEFASSGFIERTGHFPGEPRNVMVQVTRTF